MMKKFRLDVFSKSHKPIAPTIERFRTAQARILISIQNLFEVHQWFLSDWFNRLRQPLVDQIQSQMSAWSVESSMRYVSVHIRYGDKTSGNAAEAKAFSLKEYANAIGHDYNEYDFIHVTRSISRIIHIHTSDPLYRYNGSEVSLWFRPLGQVSKIAKNFLKTMMQHFLSLAGLIARAQSAYAQDIAHAIASLKNASCRGWVINRNLATSLYFDKQNLAVYPE